MPWLRSLTTPHSYHLNKQRTKYKTKNVAQFYLHSILPCALVLQTLGFMVNNQGCSEEAVPRTISTPKPPPALQGCWNPDINLLHMLCRVLYTKALPARKSEPKDPPPSNWVCYFQGSAFQCQALLTTASHYPTSSVSPMVTCGSGNLKPPLLCMPVDWFYILHIPT